MSKIITSSNNKNIGFYIDTKKDDLILCLPKFLVSSVDSISSSPNNIENEFFKFFQLLNEYKNNTNGKSVKKRQYYRNPNTIFSSEKKTYSLIEMYFSLIEDYKRNNVLLFKKMNTNLRRKGSINWSECINKKCEILFGDYVIFSKFFYNNLVYDYNNSLSILYCIELSKASKLLNYNITLPYTENALMRFDNNNSDKLSILNTFKHSIFSDREVKVFNILYCIYDIYHKIKLNYNPTSSLYYTEKFDHIWEEMLKVALFSDPNKYNQFFLTGHYVLFDKVINRAKYQPRLDIVIEQSYDGNNYLIILDAKNYVAMNSESIDSLPATESLAKQYLYKYFLSAETGLKKLCAKEQIINVFLFPTTLENKSIEHIGHYQFREAFSINEDILCFHVDFFRLREAYLNPNQAYKYKILNYIIKTFLKLRNGCNF